MKALVTGATGFVGSHLVDALLARGDHLTALVRTPTKARGLAERGVELIEGDLEAAGALARACQGQEVVYHLAGRIAARSEAEFLAVNRDGAARLAVAAERAGSRRFILLSSLAAAGPTTPGRPLRGDEPPHPTTQYGRSKLAGEEAVARSGLAWTILRPPAVYGPNDREMWRIFRAASLGVAPVFGAGSQALSLIYGPDLAEAIVAAAGSDRTIHRIYHPAHPEVLSSRSMIEAIAAAGGKRVRVVGVPYPVGRAILWCTDQVARLRGRATVLSLDKANEFFQPAWIADPTPLTDATGWRAAHHLGAGARKTFEWYRAHHWL
jgi:nucleoside-diphosphate-sugar epimerase